MGKTVESYRIALDIEIQNWSGFAKALRTDDREAFEQCWMPAVTMRPQEATPLGLFCLKPWLCRFLYSNKRD